MLPRCHIPDSDYIDYKVVRMAGSAFFEDYLMKIIYEFDPYEDKEELELFQNASVNAKKLDEITRYVRKLNKYDEREVISIEELVTNMNEILND